MFIYVRFVFIDGNWRVKKNKMDIALAYSTVIHNSVFHFFLCTYGTYVLQRHMSP